MAVKQQTFWEQQEMYCDFDEEDNNDATYVPQTHILQISKNFSEVKSKRNPFQKIKDGKDENKQQLFENLIEDGLSLKSKSFKQNQNTLQLASPISKDRKTAEKLDVKLSLKNDDMEMRISDKNELKKH